MLNWFLNPNSLLAYIADCPADNHAHQLAQFLYETLCAIINTNYGLKRRNFKM